ncbi:MAG TPA: thiol reductant ABC exporter subunit CydD, partial [Candidatus Avipropionibacterium avicola]|nr:thiol reductant ABC exporter subunit CydD [Candidatus Avipropionibacterium avicola]
MAAPIDPRLLRRSAATRGYLIATVAVGLAQTAALVAQAWLVATSVVGIVDGGGFSSDLARRLGLLAGVVAVRSGLAWAQQWLGHRASAAVKSQLRTEVMAARLRRPQQAGVSQGRLATLVGPGLDALDGWYAKFLPQLVLGVLAPVVVIVMVGRVDLLSAVIIAATLPLIPLFMVLVGLATQHQLDRRWRANAVLGHHFADLLAGLTTLQLFGRARSQAVGLERTERRHRSETMRTLRVAFLSSLVLELLATLSVALVAVTVGLRVVDAQLALLPALFVLVLAPEAFLPLRQVGAHYHDAADGTAAASEALGLIESADPDQPDDAQIPTVTRIQMSGVGTDRTAELSAELRRGELTVVTGPSGSGKTTALHLLMGWLQPTSGRITLHGDDDIVLDPSTAAAWRRQVAWVSQDPALAPGTVEDNIRFGTLATRQQAREALDRCGGATIDLDLLVGDDDQGLSVGERRRVALARALLRVELAGAGWLLLDEPTAGLDADTEAEVIAQLPAELGVVLVSHRPAVIAA